MLKKLQICFLGLLCLFPNRSRTITRHLKNYLSDKGAVFRQPQADISQERSDFISQAEGLCISNSLNHKWFVKTFLILSILLSSINEVSSQVAFSPPGIELVDNPGIPALAGSYRGGDACPDTFFSVTAQDIDGGPGLLPARLGGSSSIKLDKYSDDIFETVVDCGPSTVDCNLNTVDSNKKEFSLVDSDQDMRIGLENSSFQSASVSVFGIPILSDRQDVPQKPKTQSLVSCVLGLDTSTSLVDNSISLGQEGAIPSANREAGSAFIYAEIRSYHGMDSVEIRFWDHYLGQFITATGLELSFPSLYNGSMLEGSEGAKVFTYTSPVFEQMAYLSISSPLGDQYLDRFIVEPGDSLYLSIDLKRGDILFSGNAARKIEIQNRIQQAFRKEEFLASPSFHLTSNQDPAERRNSFEHLSPPTDGFHIKEMQFVLEGTERMQWIKKQMDSDPLDDPTLCLLEEYRPSISSQLYKVLRANIIGKQLYGKISMLKNLPLADKGETALFYETYFSDLSAWEIGDSVALLSAHYSDFLLEKESMQSRLSGESLFDLLEKGYSPALHDLLMGKFLLGNYRRLPNYEKTISTALQEVQEPFIRESLLHILEANKTGKQVEPLEMLDLAGKQVSLDEFQGKTVLAAFWFPGCMPSKLMHERHLIKVKEHFRDRQDFELLSISTDPNYSYWKQYLQENPSYRFGNINLFLGGRYSDPFLSYYDISSYPRLMLIDAQGKLVQTVRMPSDAAGLIDLISSVLPSLPDVESGSGRATYPSYTHNF